jgi:hypothetical protein
LLAIFFRCSLHQNPTNVAAVAWLLAEVWPLLRPRLGSSPGSSGTALLTLAGARPPGGSWHASAATLVQQRALGVRVVGFVADLEPLLAHARVVLSPVLKGTNSNTCFLGYPPPPLPRGGSIDT